MRSRLCHLAIKNLGAESLKRVSLVYRRVDIKGRLFVGVPRTALLGHLPATLCPASPPPSHTTRCRHRPHLLPEAKAPLTSFFSTWHFSLFNIHKKWIPCLLFPPWTHWDISDCVAGTCTTSTRRECVCECECVWSYARQHTHTAHASPSMNTTFLHRYSSLDMDT